MFTAGKNTAVCFWSWNGYITEEGIRRQLEDFAGGKFGGVIIHARAGLKVPYLSESWFSLFGYAVEQAARLGLEVWIYDEEGWPSGFAGGRIPALGDAYCHKKLCRSEPGEPLPASFSPDTLVARYEKRGEETVRCDPRTPLSDSQLVFWYEIDRHYADLLYPEVTRQFIRQTHEEYYRRLAPYFGSTVKGFFTDEPQMGCEGSYPWSECLPEYYRSRVGSDLLEDLWRITGEDEAANAFRHTLWSLLSDLYFEHYVSPLGEWCEAHGVALSGHFPMEDGLCGQLPACGDVMKNYTRMQLPGIDHLGSRVASPVLMKQAASVSRQFWDGNVMSETFGCSGWGVTFRRLKWIWGGQSVLGITKPCYHLSAYTIEGRTKRDYPAFFSAQEPWWGEFPSFAGWMDALNTKMAEGERALHTLVIGPLTGIRRHFSDRPEKQDLIRRLSAEFRMLTENLLDLQLDFDLGDEYLLAQNGETENGRLRLGKQTYDTVILAEGEGLPEQTAALLRRFAEQGGRLIALGALAPELSDLRSRVSVLVNRRDTLEKYIEYYRLDRPVTALSPETLRPVSGLRLHVRRLDGGYRVHIWPSESFTGGEVLLSVKIRCRARLLDLNGGDGEDLPLLREGEGTLARLRVEPQENRLVELIPDGAPVCRDPAPAAYSARGLAEVRIQPEEPNALTLDRAALSLDGGRTFGEEQPVILLLDRLYAGLTRPVTEAVLRYTFRCAPELDRSGLTLALEDRHCKRILLNGQPLAMKRTGSWIEECIGTYSIGAGTAAGENRLDLFYDIPKRGDSEAIREVYETEINRFSYPVEPDNVYILGRFDTVAEGAVCDRGFCYRVEGPFQLAPETEKRLGDLTEQGMWFYRGNVRCRLPLPAGAKKGTLTVAYQGVMLALEAGGKRLISHENPARFHLSELPPETGEVTLELLGHNRNLMGPHHHVYGEVRLIGPAVYEGRWDELTGFMNPGLYGRRIWTDEYGLIPFGITSVTLENR